MAISITERFLKHEEKFKKGGEIIVGADTIYFSELWGGYEKQISFIIKKWDCSWAKRTIPLMF